MTRRYQERRKLSPAYQSQAWSAAATVRNTTSSTTAITRSEYTCRATCCVQYLVIVATCVSRHTQVEPQVHRAQIENSNVTPAQAIRGALQHVPKRSSRTRIANVSWRLSNKQASPEQHLRAKQMQGTLMRKATAGIRLESQRLHRMARSHVLAPMSCGTSECSWSSAIRGIVWSRWTDSPQLWRPPESA
jgi:hypothetical protein